MMLPIQCAIFGYGPVKTVIAALNTETNRVIVGKVVSEAMPKIENAFLISNEDSDDVDIVFSEVEHLSDAIRASSIMVETQAMTFKNDVQMAKPSNAYDIRSRDENGTKYMLNIDMNSAQVASLAIAWYVRCVYRAANMADEMSSSLAEMYDEDTNFEYEDDVIAIV